MKEHFKMEFLMVLAALSMQMAIITKAPSDMEGLTVTEYTKIKIQFIGGSLRTTTSMGKELKRERIFPLRDDFNLMKKLKEP